jgi:hypothetical protein
MREGRLKPASVMACKTGSGLPHRQNEREREVGEERKTWRLCLPVWVSVCMTAVGSGKTKKSNHGLPDSGLAKEQRVQGCAGRGVRRE